MARERERGMGERGVSEGVFMFECGCLGGDEARGRPPERRLANMISVQNLNVIPEALPHVVASSTARHFSIFHSPKPVASTF